MDFPPLEHLRDALDCVTNAAIATEGWLPATPRKIEFISSRELVSALPGTLAAKDLTSNPVRWGFSKSAKAIGTAIFDKYGMDELVESVSRAASVATDEGKALSFLDSAMDGVGRTATDPGWCS